MNLLLQETMLAAGTEWSPPSTAWWFVGLVEGAAYWLGKPNALSLEPNSLLVIPGTLGGCLRASQLCGARIVFFGFVPDTIVGVFTVSDRSQVALPTDSAESTARFFPPTHSFSQEFLSLRSSRNTSTSLIYRCQLLGFAVRVLNHAEFHPPTQSTLPESDAPTTTRRLGILVQRLSDSDLIRFTGDQLAQHCGCSVRHFRRLFRQVMGVSLQQKQSELRMLKAKQLLVETNMPVVEVALECGFHHQSLFHSMFKTWFGVTPGQWRTQNRPSPSVPTREADPGIGHALTSS